MRAEGLDTLPRKLVRTHTWGREHMNTAHDRERARVKTGLRAGACKLAHRRHPDPHEVVVPTRSRRSSKYAQIAASIREVGIIEPPVVAGIACRGGKVPAPRWPPAPRKSCGTGRDGSRLPRSDGRRGLHLQQADQPACHHPGAPDDPKADRAGGVRRSASPARSTSTSAHCRARSGCSTASAPRPSIS